MVKFHGRFPKEINGMCIKKNEFCVLINVCVGGSLMCSGM